MLLRHVPAHTRLQRPGGAPRATCWFRSNLLRAFPAFPRAAQFKPSSRARGRKAPVLVLVSPWGASFASEPSERTGCGGARWVPLTALEGLGHRKMLRRELRLGESEWAPGNVTDQCQALPLSSPGFPGREGVKPTQPFQKLGTFCRGSSGAGWLFRGFIQPSPPPTPPHRAAKEAGSQGPLGNKAPDHAGPLCRAGGPVASAAHCLP